MIPKKGDEELIEVKQILDILQGDEEEFILKFKDKLGVEVIK